MAAHSERLHTMASIELLIVTSLKALVEVAGMALIGQGLIGVLAGKRKQDNFVYRIFLVVTSPIYKLARFISPRFIADSHMGLVSFFIVFWLWIALIYAKGYVCQMQNLVCVPG